MTGPDKPRRQKSPPKGSDFSRLPKVDVSDGRPTIDEAPADLEGKRALYSVSPSRVEPPPSAFGSVVIDCGRCGEQTVLSPTAALQHVVPSVHLPFIKPRHGSWMRCPACRHRTWVSVQIAL